MGESGKKATTARPAGYAALVERLGLEVIPNWHKSLIAASGTHRTKSAGGLVEETYPAKYWPGDKVADHLEFAIKYDGTNLAILASLFRVFAMEEVLGYIQSLPVGKYARRLWFLYEMLTGKVLPLDDLNTGNYVDLLDPDEYYTTRVTRPVRRQRINDNLLGNAQFCPTIRRTEPLRGFDKADLPARCRKLVSRYSPLVLKRAMSYLYTKETKSSFEIEHIKPSSSRTERFVALLQLAGKEDFCEKDRLLDLQNRIVDPRFRDTHYRTGQNYVGEMVSSQKEIVHFVCPKPEDLTGLMDGLVAAHQRMETGDVPAVIQAAAVAYGFVFLHPFEDGNGRIHRFLIHNILARRQFTPAGIIFPVSASMLRLLSDYDESLAAFSRPLMAQVEYTMDGQGRMTVENDTALWYRFIDMTSQTESLFHFIEQTIATELGDELAFLANFDEIKKAVQEIVDMPDRKIALFIQACLQNKGKLSARKRSSHFDSLSEAEVTRMEEALGLADAGGFAYHVTSDCTGSR
jgi:hypothetical protein